MKKIFLFLIFLLYISAPSQFRGISKITDDTILDHRYQPLENPFGNRYLITGSFIPVKKDSKIKLAKILTSGGWGLIDEKGETVLPPQYYNISEFRAGLVDVTLSIARQSDKFRFDPCYAVFNAKGKMITPKCFFQNDYFGSNDSDGFTRLQIKNTSELADGFLKVRIDKLTSIYDENGEQIIPAEYSEVRFSGKYFSAQKETPERHYVIYDRTGKKMKTVSSNDVYVYGELLIINQNGKTYIEHLITEKKYLENNFGSISPISYEKEPDGEKIILSTSIYDDKSKKYVSTDYINSDFEVIKNDNFPKTVTRFGKDNILAENPATKGFAIIDHKGKVLEQYTEKEYHDFASLSSKGYQNKINLEKNLIKYHPLWSKYSISFPAVEMGDLIILKIRDDKDYNNNLHVFISKKDGQVIRKIKGKTDFHTAFNKYNNFIAYDGMQVVITDKEGSIIKKSTGTQAYATHLDQLFIEESGNVYFTDKNFNIIPSRKYSRIDQLGQSKYYLAYTPDTTEILDENGKALLSIKESYYNHSDYINGAIDKDFLYLLTEKSRAIYSTKTWKPVHRFNFKSNYDGQIEGGIYVHEDYNSSGYTKTYIDPYMNVVKIFY